MKDHLRQKRGEQLGGSGEPELPALIHPTMATELRRDKGRTLWVSESSLRPGRPTGGCHHIGAADRKAQLVNYQNGARHLPPLSKPRPAEKKVLRAELKVL